ncbi:hypothetical protein GH714_000531 [Hevea brasiliensis]|uniref:Uncharacterized protein n=1 Tax=Hevea brasiliensis TaxID=3981 RepID=A0A6A6NFB9_HEVBR|nr:hypothetical protein GH714_000531 [Hevea brasiliensis]
MGKRKERRLAALSNAARRVKLDLSAEPSGTLFLFLFLHVRVPVPIMMWRFGGCSVNGEVGTDVDPTQRSGLPNSTSSSGQQPQNPLLLLGQYSDDELDKESSKSLNHAVAENSPSDHIDKEGPPSEGKEEDVKAVEDIAAEKVETHDMKRDSTPADTLQWLEDGDSGEGDATASADKCKEVDHTKLISDTGHGASGAQIIGDRAPATEHLETAPVDTNESSSTLCIRLDNSSAALTVNGSIGATLVHQSQEVPGNGPQLDESVEGCKIESLKDKIGVTDVYQNESQSNLSADNVLLGTALTNDELEKGTNLSTGLMRKCDCLLERLKSLKGCGRFLLCHDQMSKYILELDIRLSDIKSLSSYGSSLLPFWVHSQRQLKQLEDVVNKEIYHVAVSAQMEEDVEETTNTLFEEKEKSWASMRHHSDADRCENNIKYEFASVDCKVENDSNNDPRRNVYASHISSLGSPNEHVGGTVVSEKVKETPHPEPEFHSVEDVDMDVEDGVPASITALGDDLNTKVYASVKQLSQRNTSAEYPTLASRDESTVPPPSEEDWIPPLPSDSDQVPPPPDSELVPPPPPPDEPSESSYPPLPSYSETHQPLPYTEQDNLSYPDANFQYYGHTVTAPSSNLYVHADGSQVGVPHASLNYEAVANIYAETAPIRVSPVEPVAYYNLKDKSVPSLPDIDVESSRLHSESVPVRYNAFASDQIRTADKPAEAAQNLKLDVSAVVSETVIASEWFTSNSIAAEIPATTNVTECFCTLNQYSKCCGSCTCRYSF